MPIILITKLTRIILALLLVSFFPAVYSQKIENIKADQFQSEMFITYDILNALPSQVYFVKVECIIDGQAYPVASASGNGIGRVSAGPSRQIIWELNKDLKATKSDQIYFKINATPISESERNTPVESQPRGMSLSDRKFQFLSSFTSSVDNYLEQVFNLVTTLETFGERAFESRSDYQRLQNQVEKLNNAYEEIHPAKEGFKQNIRSYWGNEATNCSAETFLNRILDNLHRSQILTLNKLVKDINDIISNPKLKGSERAKVIQKITMEIGIRTPMLKSEVDIAKGDAKALYQSLKD